MSKLTPQQMDNSQLNELVLKRLRSAYNSGIKISTIISKSGVSGWRVRSVAYPLKNSPYKYVSTFTDEECMRIIDSLDQTRSSI